MEDKRLSIRDKKPENVELPLFIFESFQYNISE